MTKKLNIQEHWDQAHRHAKENRRWLTGAHIDYVIDTLSLQQLLRRDQTILEIGVGYGYCTQELKQKGLNVSALDISPIALERVRKYTKFRFLPSQISRIPSNFYDVAISHLVAQHMSNTGLKIQIKHIIRSLKPNGIFALQFAYSPHLNHESDEFISPDLQKLGEVGRTLSWMNNVVIKAGGKIVFCGPNRVFPDFSLGWYSIHIQKLSGDKPALAATRLIILNLRPKTYYSNSFLQKSKSILKRIILFGRRRLHPNSLVDPERSPHSV